jgi:hypothetical protein
MIARRIFFSPTQAVYCILPSQPARVGKLLDEAQSPIFHASDWYSSLATERGPIDDPDKRGAIAASEHFYPTTLRRPAGKQGIARIAIGGTAREFVKAAKFICSLEDQNQGRRGFAAQFLATGIAGLADDKGQRERRARD